MNIIDTTLKSFSLSNEIKSLFIGMDGYQYTKKGVIRSIKKSICPNCHKECSRNGWDSVTKKDILTLKIGRFRCLSCNIEIKKDTTFFTRIINSWYETISNFILRLKDRDVALRVISELMNFLTPMSKDTVLNKICLAVKKLIIPEIELKYQIVHYDEQHPKKGRFQKYRLTLLCATTRKVIADELYDDKDSSTIKMFLSEHLDTSKELIIITDGCPWYPKTFKDLWGNNFKHQMCVLHLNKLIMEDCGKLPSLQEMYDTYFLLSLFFDRQKELDFLQFLLSEQNENLNDKKWIKKARKRFNTFVRTLEKMRRRDKVNHTLKSYDESKKQYVKLVHEKHIISKKLKKRIKYIEDNWKSFSMFYEIDCPHTNNVIENYFSTSLKTHRKKQFRTTEGLKRKMKLSMFKRNLGFSKVNLGFLEWGKILWALKS